MNKESRTAKKVAKARKKHAVYEKRKHIYHSNTPKHDSIRSRIKQTLEIAKK